MTFDIHKKILRLQCWSLWRIWVFLHFSANKLAWNSFTDDFRRYEPPRLEAKDSFLFIAIALASVSTFWCTDSLSHSSQVAMQRRPGDTFTCSRLHYRREILSLRNIHLLWWIVSMPVVTSRVRHCRHLPRLWTDFFLFCQGCLPHSHLWKDGSEQRPVYALFTTHTKIQKTQGE